MDRRVTNGRFTGQTEIVTGAASGIGLVTANISAVGPARLRPFQSQIPAIATAEQLAASISFLLTDDGVNINGVVLASDGGWSVHKKW